MHGNHRSDVVLSIGSGIQITKAGATKKPSKISVAKVVRKRLPSGLRKNIVTALDMIESVTSCQKEWEDFIQWNRPDPTFVKVCHRLNVGLQEKPLKLDAVGDIDRLARTATDYLSSPTTYGQYLDSKYENAHQHINVDARRLLASLFYFDQVSVSVSVPVSDQEARHAAKTDTNVRQISGYLRCRLSSTMTS